MNYSKRDEEDTGFVKVDRTVVFQETRVFNTSPVSPRKCRVLLTKIALLLYTGDKFPRSEATSLFFGISKLFQNKDAALRQMVYLAIKELSNSADDVIMVTSSIMKDTTVSSDAVTRACAIRTLCRIIDGSTVQAVERYIKSAIVDKNPSVSSAALVSAYHLLPIGRDAVRRWQSETQEAASSAKSGGGGFSLGFGTSQHTLAAANTNFMSQYHAIGLLYEMRSHDRMALVKMVQQYSAAGAIKSPPGRLMLVRLATKLAHSDPSYRKPMMTLLDQWLRDKSEMVNIEAARAICNMPDVTNAEVLQAVHVLQLFLTSPRSVTRFAAIRVLHSFASFKPDAVRQCNQDIESLISNSNRSIATFAITTLLKTGNESSVDRLMKQISGFMSDITDEFKVTVVEAIRTLCLKFPSKQAGMLAFLSGVLRDEGGYEFKRSVVESIFDLIKFVPDSRSEALAHLCEFIEDCEFTKLAVRILHLLGSEGPKAEQPTKFIRYIYNRVVLENALVRAAAVTALAKFGVGQKDPEVKRSVTVLLTRCLDDVDDEVRDRAALNLRLMKEDDELVQKFVRTDSMFSLPNLEHQLSVYIQGETDATFSKPFDISTVPVVTREQALAEDRTRKLTSATPLLKAPTTGPPPTRAAAAAAHTANSQRYTEQLQAIPDIAALGGVLKSSHVVELNESNSEYLVTAIKHIFKEHVVLQFDVKNTVPGYALEDVYLECTPTDDDGEPVDLEYQFHVPHPLIRPEESGVVYVAFRRSEEYMAASFNNNLKFTLSEVDPSTNEPVEGGSEDEWPVDALPLTGADYISPSFAGDFATIHDSLPTDEEHTGTTGLLLDIKTLDEAVETLIKTLDMQALDGTDMITSPPVHTLKLYGKSVLGGKVTAEIKMAARTGVSIKVSAKSEEAGLAAMLVAGLEST